MGFMVNCLVICQVAFCDIVNTAVDIKSLAKWPHPDQYNSVRLSVHLCYLLGVTRIWADLQLCGTVWVLGLCPLCTYVWADLLAFPQVKANTGEPEVRLVVCEEKA